MFDENPPNEFYAKSTREDTKTASDNVRRHSHQSGNGVSRRDSRSETPRNGNQTGIYGKSAKNETEIYGTRRVSFGMNGADRVDADGTMETGFLECEDFPVYEKMESINSGKWCMCFSI